MRVTLARMMVGAGSILLAVPLLGGLWLLTGGGVTLFVVAPSVAIAVGLHVALCLGLIVGGLMLRRQTR